MKRFIEKTSYFLLMIITLLAITACVLRFVGFDNYIVVSGSMEPNIPTGSFAVVNRNADFDDVKIGDVIVFKYEEMQTKLMMVLLSQKKTTAEQKCTLQQSLDMQQTLHIRSKNK